MKTKQFLLAVSLILSIIVLSCSGKTPGDNDLPCLLENIGNYSLTGYSFYFAVSDNYAIISTQEDFGSSNYTLSIIDISDPDNPGLHASKTSTGDSQGIAIDGDTAYIARQEYYETGPPTGWVTVLEKIDLSTGSLDVDASIALEGIPFEMVLYEGYLYLLSEFGLYVIDSTDIAGGVISTVGDISIPGTRIFIDADSQRAYVSGQENLLEIYDISTPSNPSPVKLLENPYSGTGSPSDIAVRGNLVTLTWSNIGIVVLDISDVDDIQLAGNFETGDSALAVTFKDDYAFIADGEDGVRIMNITDPSSPLGLSQCKTGGCSWNFELIGNRLHVLDRDLGLIIYDISGLLGE